VRRISHPSYAAGNALSASGTPELRRSRLMYHEGANFTGKQPYIDWSPVVWGFVSELKHWKTAESTSGKKARQRESATLDSAPTCGGAFFQVKRTFCMPPSGEQESDPFNVDTEQMADVCSYDPGDGRDLSHVA